MAYNEQLGRFECCLHHCLDADDADRASWAAEALAALDAMRVINPQTRYADRLEIYLRAKIIQKPISGLASGFDAGVLYDRLELFITREETDALRTLAAAKGSASELEISCLAEPGLGPEQVLSFRFIRGSMSLLFEQLPPPDPSSHPSSAWWWRVLEKLEN